LLPPLMARFLNRYPGIDVRVVSGNTEAIHRQLLAYELDVAFVEGPVLDPKVDTISWREDELIILAAADHPLLTRGRIDPVELGKERWVIREEGSGTRAVAESLLREAGIHVRRVLEVGSIAAAVESVAAGLGLSMVSAAAAQEHLKVGKIGVIDFPVRFKRPLHRIRLRDRPVSPAAEVFTALAEEAADLAGGQEHRSD
jgi:DNA-binding transcriptional LysR family regulator